MDKRSGDELAGCGIVATMVGGASQVPGVRGQALAIQGFPQAASLGNLRHTCAGNLSLCPEGFTVAVWLNIQVSQLGQCWPRQSSIWL